MPRVPSQQASFLNRFWRTSILSVWLVGVVVGCSSVRKPALSTVPPLHGSPGFIDRFLPTDLRLVTYNVWFDSIFPDQNSLQSEKFVRVIQALDPDILALQEVKSPLEK